MEKCGWYVRDFCPQESNEPTFFVNFRMWLSFLEILNKAFLFFKNIPGKYNWMSNLFIIYSRNVNPLFFYFLLFSAQMIPDMLSIQIFFFIVIFFFNFGFLDRNKQTVLIRLLICQSLSLCS